MGKDQDSGRGLWTEVEEDDQSVYVNLDPATHTPGFSTRLVLLVSAVAALFGVGVGVGIGAAAFKHHGAPSNIPLSLVRSDMY